MARRQQPFAMADNAMGDPAFDEVGGSAPLLSAAAAVAIVLGRRRLLLAAAAPGGLWPRGGRGSWENSEARR